MRQRPVDVGGVVAADETTVALVALLSMVGHVDDDGILLGISLDDLRHNGIIVEGGIVVMTQHLALLVGQLRTLVLVTACPKTPLPDRPAVHIYRAGQGGHPAAGAAAGAAAAVHADVKRRAAALCGQRLGD